MNFDTFYVCDFTYMRKREKNIVMNAIIRNKYILLWCCNYDYIIEIVEFLTWCWWRWREEFVRDYFYSSQFFAVSRSLEKYQVAAPPVDCPEDSRPSTISEVGSFVRATWSAGCISSLVVPIPRVRRKRRRPGVSERCSLNSTFSNSASQPGCQAEFSRSHSSLSPTFVGQVEPNPERTPLAGRQYGSSACEDVRCPSVGQALLPAYDSSRYPARISSLGVGTSRDEGRIRHFRRHWCAPEPACSEKTRVR